MCNGRKARSKKLKTQTFFGLSSVFVRTTLLRNIRSVERAPGTPFSSSWSVTSSCISWSSWVSLVMGPLAVKLDPFFLVLDPLALRPERFPSHKMVLKWIAIFPEKSSPPNLTGSISCHIIGSISRGEERSAVDWNNVRLPVMVHLPGGDGEGGHAGHGTHAHSLGAELHFLFWANYFHIAGRMFP